MAFHGQLHPDFDVIGAVHEAQAVVLGNNQETPNAEETRNGAHDDVEHLDDFARGPVVNDRHFVQAARHHDFAVLVEHHGFCRRLVHVIEVHELPRVKVLLHQLVLLLLGHLHGGHPLSVLGHNHGNP